MVLLLWYLFPGWYCSIVAVVVVSVRIVMAGAIAFVVAIHVSIVIVGIAAVVFTAIVYSESVFCLEY